MTGERPRGETTSGLRHILRALRSRNFRLFFGGQGISLVGTWMQQVAVLWLVHRLTGSAWLLGVIGFTGRLPTLVLAPVAGVVADRYHRRRIIVITQALAMVQALVLATLTLTGAVAVWHLAVLSMVLGIINAVDIPVRQSFIVEMVDRRQDLGNAIALNSLIVNASRILGPALAGILIKLVGEGLCFLLNGISYVAVIAALMAMRTAPRPPGRQRRHVLHELHEGVTYALRHPVIRSVLPLLALVSVMGMPYAILMPAFAKEVLHGDATTNGFLMSGVGLGALCGAILLASRRDASGLPKRIALATSIFGVFLVAFSMSRDVRLAVVLLTFVGFGMMVQMVSCNTLLQTVVDDDKRGRVMSLYTMAFMGMAPFGSLLAGALGNWIGTPHTLMVSGIACLAGAAGFASRLPGWSGLVSPAAAPESVAAAPSSVDIPPAMVAGQPVESFDGTPAPPGSEVAAPALQAFAQRISPEPEGTRNAEFVSRGEE